MSQNFELLLDSGDLDFQPGLRVVPPAPVGLRARQPRPCDDREILGLVHGLFRESGTNVPRTALFASADASGLTSAVSVRAAKALASLDIGTVCIVDANVSSPSMHRLFGVPQGPGVADPLAAGGTFRSLTREVEPGLWVLPAGSPTTIGAFALAPERLKAIARDLRHSFEWVLADIGPIGAAGAGPEIATSGDGVVLVVAANTTRRAVALKIKDEIVAAGGRVLGAVLTDRTFPIPEAIYRRL